MKKRCSILLAIALSIALLGCDAQPALPSTTIATEPVPQLTAPVTTPTEAPISTETEPATEPSPTEDPTYLLSLPGFLSVFDAPSYDGCYVGSIGEKGVYTIVQEQTDPEGYLWGKLKSGIGWINLSEYHADIPLFAGLGSEKLLDFPHHIAIADDSEYMEYLVFQAKSTLTNVRLISLLPDVGTYVEDSILYTIPELTPDMPLIAQVVFYGDFTTYGLSFTDENGTQRHFAVYISGRNGAPILQEYTP